LRHFLKVPGDEQSMTNWGRSFHARGPATAKARPPMVEVAFKNLKVLILVF